MEFPARAGMNRNAHGGAGGLLRVPRTRGDEPKGTNDFDAKLPEFPATRAGMNRLVVDQAPPPVRVPRTRGDEPEMAAATDGTASSPHARGRT